MTFKYTITIGLQTEPVATGRIARNTEAGAMTTVGRWGDEIDRIAGFPGTRCELTLLSEHTGPDWHEPDDRIPDPYTWLKLIGDEYVSIGELKIRKSVLRSSQEIKTCLT